MADLLKDNMEVERRRGGATCLHLYQNYTPVDHWGGEGGGGGVGRRRRGLTMY